MTAFAIPLASAALLQATPPGFRFEVLHESRKPGSQARVGRIHTPHGVIDTPGFDLFLGIVMRQEPVRTRALV